MVNKEEIYNEVVKLRKKVISNKRAMKLYKFLREINKNDELYGWEFEDDAILTDTLEDLDIYGDDYIISVLKTYKCDLEYIIKKMRTNK